MCIFFKYLEASCGAVAQSVTVKPTGEPTTIPKKMKYLFKSICPFLRCGVKAKAECLNTRFPLSTQLCAGYSVKLIKKRKYFQLVEKAEKTKKVVDLWDQKTLIRKKRNKRQISEGLAYNFI